MDIEFNEKFIDKNIGKLCEEYDKIRGQNVNIARITPALIDGLKPVQRRALYIMSLKDGGKSLRKLATISGEVFGRVHPHCLHGDTEFLMTDGNKIKLRDVNLLERTYEILSYNKEIDEIISVRVTKHVREYHEITLSTGGSIKCTEDHEILVKEPNVIKPVWVRADRIKIGDIVYGSELKTVPCKSNDYADPITVTKVDIIKLDEEIPMYDYTVDKFGCGGVYVGGKDEKRDFFVIVKNSPTSIDDAIVNIAQPWHNIIPLIEGKGNWGCHDSKTEVLTKDGWKFFKDINKEDLLATVNPETAGMRFEHPTEIFDYEYNGDLIYCDYRAINFAVTPNHKMMIKEHWPDKLKTTEEYEFVEAGDLPEYFSLMDGVSNVGLLVERDRYISKRHYEGHVYCAEVPTYHTLVTRRHNTVLVSGNSVSGASAGASRYIYAKLSEYAIACFFEDWKDSVVDTELAYDEETRMPLYLPAKYPNVLLNGCLGIGYGIASNIPCYNFREVVESTILLMLNPKASIVLIPDSPTGADIIQADFSRICEKGTGVYMQRCTYEIDPEVNSITITSLPDLSASRDICNKIADIKEHGGLSELISMNDLSGSSVEIQLILRDDVNPYKFMRKLIKEVAGLQRSYPINVTVVDDYSSYDLSIKELLLEWIKWRREQKRAVLNNKRSTLVAEQRVTEVKMFIMNKHNLEDTIKIFRTSRNRQEIEDKLIAKYKDTQIRMDSLQARALSNMRMVELTIDAYEACVKRAEELETELNSLEETLKTKNGVDKLIIAELRDGVKRFGKPRNSNVVPYKISVSNEVEGSCTLQLSADGNIIRKPATNVEQEPIPTDSNGFACIVDNDSSFILVDHTGMHTFVRVKDLPIDVEVPVFRYTKKPLEGDIVAMLPVDMEQDRCCTIVSRKGVIKRIRINDIGPSKKPLISIDEDDALIRGIVLDSKSTKKLIIYTKNGMGQLMDNNSIKITSPSAKGGNGFKLHDDDEIIGIYAINPSDVDYLLYITTRGKMRLNNIQFLPTRKNKHDAMVQLIQLSERDKLLAIIGCNKLDTVTVFYDDASSEDVDISKLPESTMGQEPKKVTTKNAISNKIVKVKLK